MAPKSLKAAPSWLSRLEAGVDEDDNGEVDADEWGYLTYTSDYDRKVVIVDDWKVGEPAEITTGWVNYSKINELNTGDSQIMSVIITLPENETTKVEDLSGTIRVGRTSSAAKRPLLSDSVCPTTLTLP